MNPCYPVGMATKASLNVDKVSSHGGARAGAGRASRASILGVKELFDKCWPTAEREKAIKQLSKMAAQGNLDATKLLCGYAFGRPKEIKELSGIDGEAIKHVVTVHRVDRPIE